MNGVLKNIKVISTVTRATIKRKQGQSPGMVGAWLAKEFQSLGPTYIKIGQFISSRSDIFGEDFSQSFQSLRDQVKPINDNDVSKRLTEVIAQFPNDIKDVDKTPLASASIGQVHMAKAKNGQKLIIKLRRPGIQETIQSDLSFLRTLIGILLATGTKYASHMALLLDDVERFLVQEVDFDREVKNIQAFHTQYTKDVNTRTQTGVIVPKVYSRLSSHDLIVMQYVDGIPIDDYKGDRKAAARKLMNFFVQQLIDRGVVHGDPHKGNIRITSNGEIVLYDFGNVVRITRDERWALKELVYMLIIGNKYGIISILNQLGAEIMDEEAMVEYMDKYIQYVRTIDIKVFQGLRDPANRVPLRLTGTLLQLIRVYGILEGICKELDNDFSYFDLIDDQAPGLILDDEFLDYKVQRDLRMVEQRFQSAVFKFFG